MHDIYREGEIVEVVGEFFNEADELADPSTVALTIRNGIDELSTVVQGSLTHDATGIWSYQITTDQPGVWVWEFAGTGNVVAWPSGRFRVRPAVVG